MNLKTLGPVVQLNLPLSSQDEEQVRLSPEEHEELIRSLAELFVSILKNTEACEEGGRDESEVNT